MPPEVEPPELARLVAFAERPRVGDWSLRSALCRYASPQPGQVRDVLELVRRLELALHPFAGRLASDGPELWAAIESAEGPGASGDPLVGLLCAARELDRLGEVLAAWADDRAAHRPHDAVATAITEVAERLDALGVPHEERVRPPRAGSAG